MKTLFKNITKFALVALFASFATIAMASTFSSDPAGNGYGFNSINTYVDSGANQTESLSASQLNISSPGDDDYFYVFLDFWNSTSGNISNAKGRITFPSSGTNDSATFNGRLSGGNTIDNTSEIRNLPDAWEIEFVSGKVKIEDRSSNGVSCNDYYGINFNREHSFGSPGNVTIGLLREYGIPSGICDQGYVIAKFKITNTEQVTPDFTYQWQLGNLSNPDVNGMCTQTVQCLRNDGIFVDINGGFCSGTVPPTSVYCGTNTTYTWTYINNWTDADVNGVCTRTQICVQDNNNQPVSNSFCSGNAATEVNSSCDDSNPSNDEPDVLTKDYGNVTTSSAKIDGRIKMYDHDNGKAFFVYGENQGDVSNIPNDYDKYNQISTDGDDLQVELVDGDIDSSSSWDYFDNTYISGLDSNETIYYRMCLEYREDNGSGDYKIKCGVVKDFDTDRNDSNNNDDIDIDTKGVENITKNSAKICGDLNRDGGDSNLQTWMEYRKSTTSSYNRTSKQDRGEVPYCVTVRNLTPNTKYYYRACADGGECGDQKPFTTDSNGVVVSTAEPIVLTDVVYNVRANSAVLPGTYVSNAPRSTVWFQYGRSENLNKETRSYTKYGSGNFTHSFTGLKSNQRYCYRAMIRTVNGTDYGATRCFVTDKARVIIPNNPTPIPVYVPIVETVVEDDDIDIDLSRLGLGLSLIRLDIDDNQETVQAGETITYEITWENISDIDLNDLDLDITIPREMQITSTSRGILDQDRNAVFYTINRLDAGERNSMTVTGVITDGRLGDALTANATIAFDNPLNRAQENATDYDVDEFTVLTALGTASVFGLGNITFLGWLTILLGLFIVFLVARWLYLEREELRAQAYVNGYGRTPYAMAPANNHNGYIAPAAPQYVAPATPAHYVEPVHVAPVEVPATNVAPTQAGRVDYRPYRPKH